MTTECCSSSIKFYNFLTCDSCWKCQACQIQGCDKIRYQMNYAPIKTTYLVNEFLTAHTQIDNKIKRGLDSSVVIMKTNEKVKVHMYNPVNIYATSDTAGIKLSVGKISRYNNTWVCEIGPILKPVVATITIDNQQIPLIVTE